MIQMIIFINMYLSSIHNNVYTVAIVNVMATRIC